MKFTWPLGETNIDLIKRSFRILSESDRKKIRKSVFFQISLNVLDLAGVTIIGILAALAVSSIESGTPGSRIQLILRSVGLSKVSFQTQVAMLGEDRHSGLAGLPGRVGGPNPLLGSQVYVEVTARKTARC